MNTKHTAPLIDFPCTFPIKIMGKNVPEFTLAMVSIILQFDGTFKSDALTVRRSTQKNYVSITVNVYVHNQEMLDDVYRALTAHPLTLFVL